MKAAILKSKGNIEYGELDIPQIGKGEVLIKVMASGICGSDIPRVLGDEAHYYPIVLGHEFSGEIEKVGENVEGLVKGDKVSGAPLIPCHKCLDCKNGDYSLCKNYSFVGSRINGSFAEYLKLPKENVVKFDSKIPFENAVFFEPSTVAVHGVRRLDFSPEKTVAVIGVGTIGSFVLQWVKIFGAKKIFAFDVSKERRELAKELGADKTLSPDAEEIERTVKGFTGGRNFDLVYDVVGSAETIKFALEIAGNKSQVCLIGTPKTDVVFDKKDIEKINRKELFLTGSWMSYSKPFPGEEWNLTEEYLSNGKLKISDKMIFKKFPLKEASRAFDLYNSSEKINGKIILLKD